MPNRSRFHSQAANVPAIAVLRNIDTAEVRSKFFTKVATKVKGIKSVHYNITSQTKSYFSVIDRQCSDDTERKSSFYSVQTTTSSRKRIRLLWLEYQLSLTTLRSLLSSTCSKGHQKLTNVEKSPSNGK